AKVPYPDVAVVAEHLDRGARAVRGDARVVVEPRRSRERLLAPVAVDPDQRALRRLAAPEVDERAGRRDVEVRAGLADRELDVRNRRHRAADRVRLVQPDRVQAAVRGIEEMTRRQVAGREPTADDHSMLARVEVEYRDVGRVDAVAADDREQHRAAVGDDLRPREPDLAGALVRAHERLRAATGRWHAE